MIIVTVQTIHYFYGNFLKATLAGRFENFCVNLHGYEKNNQCVAFLFANFLMLGIS